MTQALPSIPERRNVAAETFRSEIVPGNRPVVIRGLVGHWPAVLEGRRSPQSLCAYLRRFDRQRPVDTLVGSPSINGHFFYREDMTGLNFERVKEPFGSALDRLLAHLDESAPPALSIQSTPIPDYLPGFDREHTLGLVSSSKPRIWIGNAVHVATHFDVASNVACVVAGRRRFTLFPPDQLPNLYVGPFDFTPSGQPVSMVALDNPDFDRYPRFRTALENAQQAELEPGDALFIPFAWWHNVQSLDRFNMLINYWWNEPRQTGGSPLDSLLHAILNLRELPANEREAWRILFNHYVFKTNGEPMDHLAPEHRGMMGPLTPGLMQQIKAALLRSLSR